jgi:hypothetical protein
MRAVKKKPSLLQVVSVSVLITTCGDERTSVIPQPSPVTPAKTYLVSGTVRDPDGLPLEGASVAIRIMFSKTSPRLLTSTDARGAFSGPLPAGVYDMEVTKPGFAATNGGVAVPNDVTLDVTLRPGVHLSGVVSELGVGPLDGVRVEVVSGPDAGRFTTTGSGVAGSFGLNLLPGDFTIRASKSGYDPLERLVSARVDTRLELQMKWAYGSCLQSVTPVMFDSQPSAGATHAATVTVNAGRSWTAAGDVPWLHVSSPAAPQTGSGRVEFTLSPHPAGDTEIRRGAVMIRCSATEGQNIWVSQLPDCQIRLEPIKNTPPSFSAAGGTATLQVRTGTPGCRWSARSLVEWAYSVGVNSWHGDLETSFVVRPNTSGRERSGTLLVGETPWEIRQLP